MAEGSAAPDLVQLVQHSFVAFDGLDFDASLCACAPDAVGDASSSGIDRLESMARIRGIAEEWRHSHEEFESRLEEDADLGGRLPGGTGRLRERSSYTDLWEAGAPSRVIVRADIDDARVAAERLAEERG